jgi:hypothetical protein
MDLNTAQLRINHLEKTVDNLKASKDNLKVRVATDFIESNEAIKERIVLQFSQAELNDMLRSLATAEDDLMNDTMDDKKRELVSQLD